METRAELGLRGFRAYPAYKSSGMEWLGEVPAHWEMLRLKRICRLSYGDSLAAGERRDGDFEVFGSNGPVGIHDRANTRGPCLVIGRKGSFGKVNYSLSPVFAIDTTFFVDPRSASSDLRWLFYALSWLALDRVSKDAAIPGLDREDAYACVLPACTREEQRAIATFLDRETAKIDALVAQKERLIELLQEKRTALITRAVTKGLDPNVPMKDSGVEWLGQIPAHWEVSKLKSAASRIIDCPHETPTYSDDGEHIVVRTSDVSEGALDLSNARRVDEFEFRLRIRRLALVADDIVYSREGERFGYAAPIPPGVSACLGQRMMQVRAGSGSWPRFLMWQLNSKLTYQQACQDTAGATSPHVNVETIRNFWLSGPPLSEQRAIAEVLDRETTAINGLIGKVRNGVDRLKEFRTALISAAVTGRIDIREA